jgi:flagellar basal-body rod protein FlgF
MLRGLYTAASGMMTGQAAMDLITNNLSNVNTAGYRKDQSLTAAFPQMLISRINKNESAVIGRLGTGSSIDEVYTTYSDGAVTASDNPLDLALQGDAYFTVRDAQGRVYATRNGQFTTDGSQRLVTADGRAVLGESGGQPADIFLPNGQLTVRTDGTLIGAVDSNGQTIDRLYLVSKPAGSVWTKEGDSLFSGNFAAPVSYSVQQSAVEGSNVDPADEMVRMIDALRAYEANSKVIQTVDDTLDKLLSNAGNI